MQTVMLLADVLFHETPVGGPATASGFRSNTSSIRSLPRASGRSAPSRPSISSRWPTRRGRIRASAASWPRSGPTIIYGFGRRSRAREFLAALDRFLENYGHRGHYESDWSLPRYNEDPTPIFQAVRAHLLDDAPAAGGQEEGSRERAAAAAWTAFIERLSWWQRLVTLPRIRRDGRHDQALLRLARAGPIRSVRVLAVLRRWHIVLADRFVERGWLDDRNDYFLVHLAEIGAVIAGTALPGTLRQTAAARRAEQDRYRTLRMPLLMKEADLPRLLRASSVSGVADLDGESLTGLPVSGGCVEAHVVVIRDPADFEHMTRGAILVAPATDPSWTPLFTLASGVIVEVGGVLSHASTIAREFGLPAIANVKHATRRLKTGDRVRLDAMSGRIDRIERVPGPSGR